MTTPTQAQIEAAAKALSRNIPHAGTSWEYYLSEAKAALTAAAQVGEQDGSYSPSEAVSKYMAKAKAELEAATIERCAQVAKKYIDNLTDHKSEFMKKWDELRHLVETYKGSDLPRMNFESMIETIAEDTEAAIRKLKDESCGT